MPTRSSAAVPGSLLYHPLYARLLCEVTQARGLPVATLLQDAGLDPSQIGSAAQHLSHVQMNALIRAARTHFDDAFLAFEWGARCRDNMHGLAGTATLCSRDLRQALATLCQLSNLRSSLFRGQLSEVAGQVRLQFTAVVPSDEFNAFIFAALGLLLAQLLAALLGSHSRQLRVELPMDEPDCAATAAALFPGPLVFGAATLSLCMPEEMLDLPCPSADAHAYATALRQCSLDQLGLKGDAASRLRAHLANCQLDYPSLEDSARLLCISPRSLSRALQQAGCTYQQLLDEARQQQALTLLQDSPLAVEQIAWQLGYADPSNFIRAFRRWQGCTPQAWRASRMA